MIYIVNGNTLLTDTEFESRQLALDGYPERGKIGRNDKKRLLKETSVVEAEFKDVIGIRHTTIERLKIAGLEIQRVGLHGMYIVTQGTNIVYTGNAYSVNRFLLI